jgi:hypothetical protein
MVHHLKWNILKEYLILNFFLSAKMNCSKTRIAPFPKFDFKIKKLFCYLGMNGDLTSSVLQNLGDPGDFDSSRNLPDFFLVDD